MQRTKSVDGNLDNPEQFKKYFYHTDHLGSTIAVTDEAGNKVWDGEYTPFGIQLSGEGELLKAAKFTGKDLDEDIGLYYFNARWYDQELGRFVSEDPIKDGMNWYVYGKNNPLAFVDLNGLESVDAREIYLEWQSGWVAIYNYAVKKEASLRKTLRDKDPIGFADKYDLFLKGKRDALGEEYQQIANLLDYSKEVIGNSNDVLTWLETEAAKGNKATIDQINNKVHQIIKGKSKAGWINTVQYALVAYVTQVKPQRVNRSVNKNSDSSNVKGTSKTEIIGKPHASAQHQAFTMDEVNKLASTGNYSKIYINRSLKTAGFNGTQKPDIIAVGVDGKVHIIEIASPSQLSGKPWTLLNNKLITMLRNNPGMTGRVISPKY